MSLISGLLNSLAGNIFGGGKVGTPNKATMGAQLRTRSKFNVDTNQFAHTDTNKFSFGSLVYPEVLETDPGLGHYMLFYIYRTKNSKYRGAEGGMVKTGEVEYINGQRHNWRSGIY